MRLTGLGSSTRLTFALGVMQRVFSRNLGAESGRGLYGWNAGWLASRRGGETDETGPRSVVESDALSVLLASGGDLRGTHAHERHRVPDTHQRHGRHRALSLNRIPRASASRVSRASRAVVAQTEPIRPQRSSRVLKPGPSLIFKGIPRESPLPSSSRFLRVVRTRIRRTPTRQRTGEDPAADPDGPRLARHQSRQRPDPRKRDLSGRIERRFGNPGFRKNRTDRRIPDSGGLSVCREVDLSTIDPK
jgi:hypothetical protein